MKQNYSAILLLILIFFTFSTAAAAQEDDLIIEPSVDYSFGQELRFNIQVSNASDVQKLTLRFRPELSTNLYEVEVLFEPGDTIAVTQPVAVAGLDLRPYSDVTYSWEVQTADDLERIPQQRFTYEDDRFPWQAMVREGVTAHWTGATPIFGQNVLDITESALADLQWLIPLENIDPIDIYIYPSTADIRAALQLAGFEDGDAEQKDLGVLLITSVNEETAVSDLEHALPYELAHLLLYRTAGEQAGSLPYWLREGIAENARISENPGNAVLLADAVNFNDTFPLWRLCDQPEGSAARQELAAVQSASIVSYLVESRPTGTIPALLAAYLSGDNCEQGLRRVLSSSLDELEDDWLDSLQEPTSSQDFLSDAAPWVLLLIGGTILAVIVIIFTRRKE